MGWSSKPHESSLLPGKWFATRTEHRKMGTCVGLFLVDVLIEQLDGRLEITSDPRGTTCRIVIPTREKPLMPRR